MVVVGRWAISYERGTLVADQPASGSASGSGESTGSGDRPRHAKEHPQQGTQQTNSNQNGAN